jgi:release factor glutamine methyltransferase
VSEAPQPENPPDLPVDTIGATLTRDGDKLAAALGLEFAEGYREAQGLLASVAAHSRAKLAARQRDAVDAEVRALYEDLIGRRLRGEPYAYLVGHREFHGLDFLVSPAVLIPRPETELLVDTVLAWLGPDREAKILDLGTGSGAVAIPLALLRPRTEMTAIDASADALAVARDNAARLGAHRIRFLQSDWYAALRHERFDVIVSNPPYVAADDPHLAQGDLRFEPRGALIGGADGLDCIRILVNRATSYLRPGGALFFEHGNEQAAVSRSLLDRAHFEAICTIADLAGIERVTCGQMGLD